MFVYLPSKLLKNEKQSHVCDLYSILPVSKYAFKRHEFPHTWTFKWSFPRYGFSLFVQFRSRHNCSFAKRQTACSPRPHTSSLRCSPSYRGMYVVMNMYIYPLGCYKTELSKVLRVGLTYTAKCCTYCYSLRSPSITFALRAWIVSHVRGVPRQRTFLFSIVEHKICIVWKSLSSSSRYRFVASSIAFWHRILRTWLYL